MANLNLGQNVAIKSEKKIDIAGPNPFSKLQNLVVTVLLLSSTLW